MTGANPSVTTDAAASLASLLIINSEFETVHLEVAALDRGKLEEASANTYTYF